MKISHGGFEVILKMPGASLEAAFGVGAAAGALSSFFGVLREAPESEDFCLLGAALSDDRCDGEGAGSSTRAATGVGG